MKTRSHKYILTTALFASILLNTGSLTAQEPFKNEAGKWGYKNAQNQIVIEPKYDKEIDFYDNENTAKAYLNGKVGLIDRSGKTITPFMYEDVGFLGEGLVPVRINKKWGFVDINNKMVIKPQFNSARAFNEGLAGIAEGGTLTTGEYEYLEGAKWGFINKTGQIVIKPQFDHIYNFSDGLAVAGNYLEGNRTPLYGYINKTGKLIIDYKYSYAGNFVNGIAISSIGMGLSNNEHFFINKSGASIFPSIMCERIDGDGNTFKAKGKVKVHAYDDDFKNVSYYINIKGEKVP